MDYSAALKYILGFTDLERSPAFLYSPKKFDLRRMEELLEALGNPHRACRAIHIAGTKGKGSTAAMIVSALTSAGYRTGLYTSPHLHSFRERIRVDGCLISEEEFAGLVEEVLPTVDSLNRRASYGRLSTFELLTALAFMYFQRRRTEFEVLEVGIGGRLDATNVVQPLVAVITNISYDHMQVLGHTLEEIAREKAGIIKPRSRVVISPQVPQVEDLLERICHERGATTIKVGRDLLWSKEHFDLDGQSFKVKGRKGDYSLYIPLLGDHQLENATAAVAVLEELDAQKISIPEERLIEGFRHLDWPGRLELLSRKPLLVVDVAHNDFSARRLREALIQCFKFQRFFLVMGCSVDKDIEAMVEEMAPLEPIVIATRSRHPRAAPTTTITQAFAKFNISARSAEEVSTAVAQAMAMAGPDDLVCVMGSVFVVAEAREWSCNVSSDVVPVQS